MIKFLKKTLVFTLSSLLFYNGFLFNFFNINGIKYAYGADTEKSLQTEIDTLKLQIRELQASVYGAEERDRQDNEAEECAPVLQQMAVMEGEINEAKQNEELIAANIKTKEAEKKKLQEEIDFYNREYMNNAEKAIVYGIIALAAIAATIALAVSNSNIQKKIDEGYYSQPGTNAIRNVGEMQENESVDDYANKIQKECDKLPEMEAAQCNFDKDDVESEIRAITEQAQQYEEMTPELQEEMKKEIEEFKNKYNEISNRTVDCGSGSVNALLANKRLDNLYSARNMLLPTEADIYYQNTINDSSVPLNEKYYTIKEAINNLDFNTQQTNFCDNLSKLCRKKPSKGNSILNLSSADQQGCLDHVLKGTTAPTVFYKTEYENTLNQNNTKKCKDASCLQSKSSTLASAINSYSSSFKNNTNLQESNINDLVKFADLSIKDIQNSYKKCQTNEACYDEYLKQTNNVYDLVMDGINRIPAGVDNRDLIGCKDRLEKLKTYIPNAKQSALDTAAKLKKAAEEKAAKQKAKEDAEKQKTAEENAKRLEISNAEASYRNEIEQTICPILYAKKEGGNQWLYSDSDIKNKINEINNKYKDKLAWNSNRLTCVPRGGEVSRGNCTYKLNCPGG